MYGSSDKVKELNGFLLQTAGQLKIFKELSFLFNRAESIGYYK